MRWNTPQKQVPLCVPGTYAVRSTLSLGMRWNLGGPASESPQPRHIGWTSWTKSAPQSSAQASHIHAGTGYVSSPRNSASFFDIALCTLSIDSDDPTSPLFGTAYLAYYAIGEIGYAISSSASTQAGLQRMTDEISGFAILF